MYVIWSKQVVDAPCKWTFTQWCTLLLVECIARTKRNGEFPGVNLQNTVRSVRESIYPDISTILEAILTACHDIWEKPFWKTLKQNVAKWHLKQICEVCGKWSEPSCASFSDCGCVCPGLLPAINKLEWEESIDRETGVKPGVGGRGRALGEGGRQTGH